MKINKIDIIILVIPIIIMFLLTPVLPDKVPIHWNIKGVANGFIDKRYAFALGLVPFAVYKSIKLKYSSK
jgi:uncharacterized membrane protein